jgi:hypothetical protein
MTTTQPAPARTAVALPWSRIFCFIAFVCALIAALTFADVFYIGPAWAWFAGGFASWWLAQSV